MNLLRRLLSRPSDAPPVELKPGFNALGVAGNWTLTIRVYRAAEDRWYDLEELKS